MNLSESELAQSAKNLYQLFDSLDDWTLEKKNEKSGVKVYRMKQNWEQIHAFRGDSIVNHPAQTVIRLLWDGEGKGLFDPLCARSYTVREITTSTRIEHQIYVTKQCAATIRRDVLIVHHLSSLYDGGYLLLAQSDGVDEASVAGDVQEVPKSLRANVFISGWLVKPLSQSSDDSEGQGQCSVSYITQVDLGGLPAAIQNMAGSQQPMVIRRLEEYLSAGNRIDGRLHDDFHKQYACHTCFLPITEGDTQCPNCRTATRDFVQFLLKK